MTDAERIALVQAFANATIGGVHAMNTRGSHYKGVQERRAAKALLTALLGEVAEHAALAGIANPAAVPEVITAARLAYGVLSGQLGNPDGQHQRIARRLQLALDDLDKKEGE